MSSERNLSVVPPILLTANGGTQGQLTLATTLGIFVKQNINIQSGSVPSLQVQVKYVINETQILVGAVGHNLAHRIDVSAYTVAQGTFVFAGPFPKAVLPMEERLYATYIQEPSNSWRVTPVDSFGNSIDETNPWPVTFDGTVSIGDVHILGPSPTNNELNVNNDGSINVNIVSVPVVGNTVRNIYNEANSVVGGVTTIVVQYTVPGSLTNSILQRISVSGENIAKFTVFVNGTQIDTRRTFYGSSLSEYFEFITGSTDGFVLNPADILVVKVLHTRPYVGDFEGRIQVLEIT